MAVSTYAANAQCLSSPQVVSKEVARSVDFGGYMFMSKKGHGNSKYKTWSVSKVAHLPRQSCFEIENSMKSYLGTYKGTFALNNHLPNLPKDPKSKKKYDLPTITIKLNRKADPSEVGQFDVRLYRSAKCTWYRQGEKQRHYKINANFSPENLQDHNLWNGIHALGAKIKTADKYMEGSFHGAPDKTLKSTWQKRNMFRLAQELTKHYDVEILVRTFCFSNTSDDNYGAGMVNFPVQSGTAGVIVSYFSANADIKGTVRFCKKVECRRIERLRVNKDFNGFFAWLRNLGRTG
jgi:hypothetical protein